MFVKKLTDLTKASQSRTAVKQHNVGFRNPAAGRARAYMTPAVLLTQDEPLAALPTIGAERTGSECSRRSAPRGSAQAVRNAGDTYITGDIGHLLVVNADYAAKMQSVNWQLTNYRLLVS